MNRNRKGIVLAAGLSLVWCQICFAAPQKNALKAIDPSSAQFAQEPAPPPPSPPPAPSAPLGRVEGAPLTTKRTLANPNPEGITFLKDDTPPPNPYGAPPQYQQYQPSFQQQAPSGYQQSPYGQPAQPSSMPPGFGQQQQFQQPPPQFQSSGPPAFMPNQQQFQQPPQLQSSGPPPFMPNQQPMQQQFQQPPQFQQQQPVMQQPAFQPNQPPAFIPNQPPMQQPGFQQQPAFQPTQPPAFVPSQQPMQQPGFQQQPAFRPNQPPVQQQFQQQPGFGQNPGFQAGMPQGFPQQQNLVPMPSPSGFPGGSAQGPGPGGQPFPAENMIPQFGQPLPQVPPSQQAFNGPGFGAGPAPGGNSAPQGSPDETRAGALEQIAFGTTYPEHEVDDRVDHLELEVFGTKNKAATALSERLFKLESKLGIKSAFGGGAPYTPPQMGPQTSMLPPQQQAPWTPPQQRPIQQPISRPVAVAPANKPAPPVTPSNDQAPAIVANIPEKRGAGDFFAQISRFDNGTVARWTGFPVLVHLPGGSPDGWQRMLEQAISKWNPYIPVRAASQSEPADIEVAWINHLPPRQLGLTNLEVFNGKMRVTIYLLRPSYYLPTTPEKTLSSVAQHELGHALGLFGHSTDPQDIMFPIELPSSGSAPRTKSSGITARDLNTLKRIYQTPPLPPGYQTPHPMGWSSGGHSHRKN